MGLLGLLGLLGLNGFFFLVSCFWLLACRRVALYEFICDYTFSLIVLTDPIPPCLPPIIALLFYLSFSLYITALVRYVLFLFKQESVLDATEVGGGVGVLLITCFYSLFLSLSCALTQTLTLTLTHTYTHTHIFPFSCRCSSCDQVSNPSIFAVYTHLYTHLMTPYHHTPWH